MKLPDTLPTVEVDLDDRPALSPPEPSQSPDDDALRMLELRHRTKNILAIVQSLVAQTVRGEGSLDEARERLSHRLVAMGKAVDTLLQTDWKAAPLRDVAAGALIHAGSFGQRLTIDGPPVAVGPGAAMALSLALHELESNAIKYGSLSNETGTVSLAWHLGEAPALPVLHLCWRETGGPPVIAPTRSGFGTKLISSGVARRLGGRADCRFEPDGFVWEVVAPLDGLAD